MEKIKGLLSVLVFLGIMDTMKQEICLPSQKIDELKRLIVELKSKSLCRKWELLSLISKLAHAMKVVMVLSSVPDD